MQYTFKKDPGRDGQEETRGVVISATMGSGLRIARLEMQDLDDRHDLIRPVPEENVDPAELDRPSLPGYVEFVGDAPEDTVPFLQSFNRLAEHLKFRSCSSDLLVPCSPARLVGGA
jgi:hypothetical protein